MKLLKEFEVEHDADALVSRLRKAGVFAVTTSKGARSLVGAISVAVKIGVWVVDEQFSDARQLINNKRHLVEKPLTEEQMILLEHRGKTSYESAVKHLIVGVVSLLVVIAVLLLTYNNSSS